MSWPIWVKKRNGEKENFNQGKIASSIFKAAQRVGGKNKELAKKLAKDVVKYLKRNLAPKRIISSEEIGNAVEKVLIEKGHARTARAYILYRESQRKTRKKLIKLKDLPLFEKFLRLTDQRIVFVTGVYDLLHIGHVRYLRKASSHGDVMIVGLNSDESAKKLKGETRPVLGEEVRAEMLSYLDFVDYIVIYSWVHAGKIIKILKPDVYVCVEGSWSGNLEDKAEVKVARQEKIEVVVIPYQSQEVSTSKIIDKVKNSSHGQG